MSIHPEYRSGVWRLDPNHSELNFSIRHLAISKVRGTFDSFAVTVQTFDDPQRSTIDCVIEVASVSTRQPDRDKHLRTGDFFLTQEFPQATFRAVGFDQVEGDGFTITGDLTLRGVTKPVTLVGEFGGITVDASGNTRVGVTAQTQINRHDFGVSWNRALEAGGLTLGDDVAISLDLQLALEH